MRRRRSSRPGREPPSEPTALLGVLSVQLLLIPALLLMSTVTDLKVMVVSPERVGGPDPSNVTSCGAGPRFQVGIARGGLFIRIGDEPWKHLGAPAGGCDHHALEAEVRAFKRAYPHEVVAFVAAEDDVAYQTLVTTLDTLRGPGCRLNAAQQGEAGPDECLLWIPVIEDRRPNRDVPEFRRDEVWPPWAPRDVTPVGQTPRAG